MSKQENTQPNEKKYIGNKKKATKIIRFRTLMASGIGFLPFPILDTAGILSIQLWMIRDIAKIYNVPFKKNVARSIIGTLVGNIGAVSMIKLIPGINILGGGAMAASAGAATYALGKVFTQHFDQGGTLLSFDPIKSRAYFEEVYEESKITVEELKTQEDSFKEVDVQALASVATLKKANSELMATINNLEKQLKNSKKERAVAVAVAKTQTRAKALVPKSKEGRTWIGWLWRIVLVLVIIALLVLALFQFNIIGKGSNKNNTTGVDSLGTNTKQSIQKSSIISEPEINPIDTITLSDSTNSFTNPNDTITNNGIDGTNENDTTTQNILENTVNEGAEKGILSPNSEKEVMEEKDETNKKPEN